MRLRRAVLLTRFALDEFSASIIALICASWFVHEHTTIISEVRRLTLVASGERHTETTIGTLDGRKSNDGWTMSIAVAIMICEIEYIWTSFRSWYTPWSALKSRLIRASARFTVAFISGINARNLKLREDIVHAENQRSKSGRADCVRPFLTVSHDTCTCIKDVGDRKVSLFLVPKIVVWLCAYTML